MKKNNAVRKKILNHVLDRASKPAFLLALLLNAACMLILMEIVWRGEYASAMIFLVEETAFAACGALFILLSSLMLLFLFGSAAPALAANNLFFLLLGAVQYFKIEMRGEPFQFSDLAMAKEALGVAGNMMGGGIEITPYMVITLAVMGVLIPLLMTGRRVLAGRRLRRAAAFLCSVMLIGACVAFMLSDYMGLEEGFNMTRQDDDYKRRGMITAFVNRIPLPGTQALDEPEGYTQEAVEAILAKHKGAGAEPAVKPDILFLMSESLYDVTQDLRLSEDPLSGLRALQAQHWGGNFITPVYGGSTVVVEYEVMTGYRAAETDNLCFTAPGGVISEGMSSMISLLKSYGYYIQSLHPGVPAFYSRESAYGMMGFDKTMFKRDMEPEKEEPFSYPSDEYLFDHIIKEYENRPKDQPWFCHAVTYQNHGGYGFAWDENRVRVEETGLDETEMLNARNYVNMLKVSDDELLRLVEYFDRQESPVLIVFWGDHAPAIRQFGKKLSSAPAGMLRHYTTPLLVYSNYGQDTSMLPENIASYRLGAYMMRMLGMDRDPYLNYLSSEDAKNVWVYGDLVEENGVWRADAQVNKQASDTMLMLHYDRLFGENYGGGL